MARKADNLRTVDPNECEKAAKALRNAFVWSDLREGHQHWSKIVDRLEVLAKGENSGKQDPTG